MNDDNDQQTPHVTISSLEEAESWINVLNRRSIRDSQSMNQLHDRNRDLCGYVQRLALALVVFAAADAVFIFVSIAEVGP